MQKHSILLKTFRSTNCRWQEAGADEFEPTKSAKLDSSERVTESCAAKPRTFLPFSDGPRSCIGQVASLTTSGKLRTLISDIFLSFLCHEMTFNTVLTILCFQVLAIARGQIMKR